MSDLSVQIEEALRFISDCQGADSTVVDVSSSDVAELPSFDAMREHYAQQANKAVRRVYRKYAGGKQFASPQDALDQTREAALRQMVPVAVAALADGVQMGQCASFSYKKYLMFDKLDELFDVPGFREESGLFGLTVEGDVDARAVVQDYILSSMLYMGSCSGFMYQSEEQLSKIWDLWAVSMASVTIGMYSAGHLLGKRWKEQDTLQGILAATERGEK